MCPKIWNFPWFSRRRTWISFFSQLSGVWYVEFSSERDVKARICVWWWNIAGNNHKNGKLLKIKKRRRERVRESAGGERSWGEKWKWWKNFQWKMYGENGENFSFYAFHLDRRKKVYLFVLLFFTSLHHLMTSQARRGSSMRQRGIKCQ